MHEHLSVFHFDISIFSVTAALQFAPLFFVFHFSFLFLFLFFIWGTSVPPITHRLWIGVDSVGSVGQQRHVWDPEIHRNQLLFLRARLGPISVSFAISLFVWIKNRKKRKILKKEENLNAVDTAAYIPWLSFVTFWSFHQLLFLRIYEIMILGKTNVTAHKTIFSHYFDHLSTYS